MLAFIDTVQAAGLALATPSSRLPKAWQTNESGVWHSDSRADCALAAGIINYILVNATTADLGWEDIREAKGEPRCKC
jgi:hypothetical protein